MMKKLFIIIALIGAIIFIGSFFIDIDFGKAKFENATNIKTYDNSFVHTIDSFQTSNNKVDLNNKIIFFNTWATWCGPCIREIPYLGFIQKQFENDTNVIFLSYCSDAKKDSVEKLLARKKFTFDFNIIDASDGLRMSLNKIAKTRYDIEEIDTNRDGVPVNLIINFNDSLAFYQGHSIEPGDTARIIKLLNDLLLKKRIKDNNLIKYQ